MSTLKSASKQQNAPHEEIVVDDYSDKSIAESVDTDMEAFYKYEIPKTKDELDNLVLEKLDEKIEKL